MNYLRQSTSVDVGIGPFVDSTDGFTAETALTITQPDVRLKKNNGNWAQKAAAQTLTHEENGWYEVTLDATDTDTVGILLVAVNESGALPVWREFQVLEEAVFDALIAAAAPGYLQPTTAGRTLDVSATGEAGLDWANIGSPTTAQNLSGTNIDVDQVVASVSGNVTGSIGSVAANGITLASLATSAREGLGLNRDGTLSGTHSDTTADLGTSAPATDITGQTLFFPDHDLSRLVTAYNTGTGVATFESIGVTLANGNTWYLFPTAPSSGGGGGLDAAGVRAAIGMASANMDTQLSGIQSDTNDIQARLPAALVSGRIDASVGAMAANVMTAAAAAADLTTELQAGLSTLDAAGVRSAVGLASANLDTQLSGIQADTDNIQTRIPAALVSGRIDASVGAMANNVMTAAAAAADLTTELQSGLATAADLATVDANVDSLVSGIIFGAAATGTLSTTQATTNLAGYANDQLIGRVVIWLTGNCEGEATDITDYASAGGLLTFTALTTAPANGDTFKIV